jgi:acetyl-CoA C-acetyltransferase
MEVVIVAGVRTAIGKFNGKLSTIRAHQLGSHVMTELLRRTGVAPNEVSEVVMGQVLTAAAGQNPARQAAMGAGLPVEIPAYGVNQVCGSGLRAVALGFQSIRLGDSQIVIAGGQESMSQSPHAIRMRNGIPIGDGKLVDTMICDGLWDAFGDMHMGITAENVADRWKISREEQDEFAAGSQQRAAAAWNSKRFDDEIVPIKVQERKTEILFDRDEDVRSDTTAQILSGLRPAFKPEGSVTAGNSSRLNDGAAGLVLMDVNLAKARKLGPLFRIVSWASVGVDPSIMGVGPITAIEKALSKAGWQIHDLDLIEVNEAFAAQSCAVAKTLRLDPKKLNVNGGAIALGHPIGASGARLLVTLTHEMAKQGVRRGLVSLCIGGGMGIALCVEAIESRL